MKRSVNNVVAIIPEWEFEKLNLKAVRRKVGNGYIVQPKDLDNYNSSSIFSMKVIELGGIPITMQEATRMIKGSLSPIIFTRKEDSDNIEEIKEDKQEITEKDK